LFGPAPAYCKLSFLVLLLGGDEGEDDIVGRHDDAPPILKKPNISLLSFYHCNWKTRHNHFHSYSEVKVKEERRPTVTEMANQRGMHQRASGWRLYHLSSQLEDVMEDVMDVHSRLSKFQKSMIPTKRQKDNPFSDELRTINELFEGNLQRCKLVHDQTDEARESMMKVLEHKARAIDIISKHHKRRPVKHPIPTLSL
jgi:histone deacetylase complex subunit SAP130